MSQNDPWSKHIHCLQWHFLKWWHFSSNRIECDYLCCNRLLLRIVQDDGSRFAIIWTKDCPISNVYTYTEEDQAISLTANTYNNPTFIIRTTKLSTANTCNKWRLRSLSNTSWICYNSWIDNEVHKLCNFLWNGIYPYKTMWNIITRYVLTSTVAWYHSRSCGMN